MTNFDEFGILMVETTDACGCDITDPNGYVCCVEFPNAEHIAHINPFRYRSYYYDIETALYYLQTRYYDPEPGRFILPNSINILNFQSLNRNNLYCYAINNPIVVTYKNFDTKSGNNGMMICSIESYSTNSMLLNHEINSPFVPEWIEHISTALDLFASFSGTLETSIWGMTTAGRAFSDFHYITYGIDRFTILDELTSPLTKLCQGISVGLIVADLFMNIHNSVQQGYSFAQGATSFALTAGKDIGVYVISAKVAGAVGAYIVGSKIGAALGAWAGPVGIIVGAAAGFAVGYVIDEFGDMIIDWVMELFD